MRWTAKRAGSGEGGGMVEVAEGVGEGVVELLMESDWNCEGEVCAHAFAHAV